MHDLPNAPSRLLVSHDAHHAMATMIQEVRPQIEILHKRVEEVTANDLQWADAYLGFRPPPVRTLGNISWVHSTGAGVDPWLFPLEMSDAILLTRSSESFGPMIAEWALSRALIFSQRIMEFAGSQKRAAWQKQETTLLRGTTAVVVGTGDVGAHVGQLFRAMGCRVHGVSRSGRGDATVFHELSNIEDLATVVDSAQWLLLMLPLTAATLHLIDRTVLRACRGAVLLNAGRGAVIDETAIPEALDAGWLRGAALDVFEEEPLPERSPLWHDPRVIVSPHISGVTTVAGAVNGFVECFDSLAAGKRPRWAVNRALQY